MTRGPGVMTGAALLLAVWALAPPARGHSVRGERDVVVQAERDAVAVLVSYRPPPGPAPSRARELEKAALTARALAPLRLALDGTPLAGAAIEVKLVEDPPASGRPLLVALVTAPVAAGEHRLTVDVSDDREPTSTMWIDRSSGRVREHGPGPSGPAGAFRGRGQLVVVWR
jgi:hypothetical protein